MKKPGAKTIIRELLEELERVNTEVAKDRAAGPQSQEAADLIERARGFLNRKPAKRMTAGRAQEGNRKREPVLRFQAAPGQLIEFLDANGECLFEAFLSDRSADSLTVRAKANDVWREGNNVLLLPELIMRATDPGQFHFTRRAFRQ